MNKRGNFVFIDIEENAGLFAKLVKEVENDDHVLHRTSDEISVIRVPLAGEL